MKRAILLLGFIFTFATNVSAGVEKQVAYIDHTTNETLYIVPSKNNTKPKPLTIEEVSKLYKTSYTRRVFGYNDKIGNPYNCFVLNEGIMLSADFIDERGWVAKVRHMNGRPDTYTYTGNASFIKVPDFGYSFCVRRD